MEIKINENLYSVSANERLIDVLLKEGIFIPHICYDPDLKPVGSCGLCLVEVKGKGIVKACEETVEDGMEIITESDELNRARKDAFIFLLRYTSHPTTCLFCDRYDECEGLDNCLKGFRLKKGCKICPKDGDCIIQELAKRFGLLGSNIRIEEKGLEQIKEPFFIRDYDYCILCSKCIRECYEKRLRNACISYMKINGHVPTFVEQGCEFCGSCLDICPTGAIYNPDEDKVDTWVRSICPYCGVGCGIRIGVRENRVVKIKGDKEGINKGELCAKGRFGIEFVNSKERLESPLLRRHDSFVPISWEEAIRIICENFKKYMEKLAILGSAKCTNEENFLIQKFSRLVLKTNNIDHCARLCHSSTAVALSLSLGYSAMTNSIEEITKSKTIIVIGANPTENHPIIGLYIKKAKQMEATLVVINPIKIELCDMADIWLRPFPGTDIALLNAIARIIVDRSLEDKDFIGNYTDGFYEYKEYLRSLNLVELSNICRVSLDDIGSVAEIYAKSKPSSIYFAMGITQHLNGTENVLAISNLALLTGNLGIPGAGINPLRGQNNVQGACDMGVLPDLLPGYRRVDSYEARRDFEEIWNGDIPSEKGLTLVEMFEGVLSDQIKAMYIIGENPAVTDPDLSKTKEALDRLGFLVVQDIFMSDTARFADIILPGASFAEKDGTFTNTERRVQRIRRAINAPGIAKSDWEIICLIGKAMGYERAFSYKGPEDIFDEIRRLVPEYRGITYKRLEEESIQWPCPYEGHPGTRFLYSNGFPKGKARFFKVDTKPKDTLPDKRFPFLLTTGRCLYHYHTGTMSMKTRGIKDIYPEPFIEISPEDAKEMGISEGDVIELCSESGIIKGKARISSKLSKGILFTTFHFSKMPVNLLVEASLDPLSKIPAFKTIPVNILPLTENKIQAYIKNK